MIHRIFIALFILCFFIAELYAQDSKKPNVIIILTDDQGWGDLSIHGNTNLATAHVDFLAGDGGSF